MTPPTVADDNYLGPVDDNYLGRLRASAGRSQGRVPRAIDARSKAHGITGKRITDHQVLKYKAKRRTKTQAGAAAKAGISERSARRNEPRRPYRVFRVRLERSQAELLRSRQLRWRTGALVSFNSTISSVVSAGRV
jgi:hypothetical protein